MLQCASVVHALMDTQPTIVFPKTKTHHIGNNLTVTLVLHSSCHMLCL